MDLKGKVSSSPRKDKKGLDVVLFGDALYFGDGFHKAIN